MKTSVRDTYLKDYGLTYDCMETDVREDAGKSFKSRTHPTVNMAQYLAQKYRIGGDADEQEDS